VLEQVDKFAAIIEALFELVFPFNPINYMTIPYISTEMIDFLYAPVPYIVGCNERVFKDIQKTHWKYLEPDVMVIHAEKIKVVWNRKVKYPQPHTKYF